MRELSLRVDVDAHHGSPHVRKPNCRAASESMSTSKVPARADPTTVAPAPGCPPRLLGEQPQTREDLAAYRARGGYRPLGGADELLSEVESRGLVGRGGAAFPLAVKLRTVRDNGSRAGGTVAVANGEEGEPASIKDRWLL